MQRMSAVERNKKPVGTLDIPDDFAKYYLNKKDKLLILIFLYNYITYLLVFVLLD